MSEMKAGTRNGEIRWGPLSNSTRNCSSSQASPPIPEPIIAPISLAAEATSSFEWSIASCVAAIESWTKRSIRRASFFSIQSSGSKPPTSPAIFDSRSEASQSVTGPDAVLAGEQRLPRRVAADAERGHHAHAGDDDAARRSAVASVAIPPPEAVGDALVPVALVPMDHCAPSQRPKISTELCPPSPTEVLIAWRTVSARALFGT